MLRWGAYLAVFIAVTFSISAKKIDPVKLNHHCLHINQKENQDRNEKQNKSPILLVHGLSGSMNDWKGLYEVIALGTGRRVCRVDLRDHGDSPHTDVFTVEAMTVDIEHFLNQENIQQVNIVGLSLGGKIAVHLSLKSPDRVASAVVGDMRPNGLTEVALAMVNAVIGFLGEAISSIPEGSSENEARKALLDVMNKKLKEVGSNDRFDDSLASYFSIRLVDGKWQWKANLDAFKKAMANTDEFLTESKGLYKGPALFIYGTKSPFDIPGDKDNIMKLFPNAQLIPIEGADHNVIMDNRFSEEVIKMINKLD